MSALHEPGPDFDDVPLPDEVEAVDPEAAPGPWPFPPDEDPDARATDAGAALLTTPPRATRFEQHARWYAGFGWATIPVNGKDPKPKRWQHTKADEPELAAGKWRAWGERHNMGVVCGSSRLAVVDVDHADAESVYRDLFGALPATPIVHTGRDKRLQLYFRDPGGLDKTARDGLELRVGPHMCVLPPSEHPDTGRVYEWRDGHEPWTLDLVPVPQTVLDYFGTARQNGSAPVVEGPIPEGGRHDALMRNACAMRRRGMGESEILAALRETNRRRCVPPLADDEVAELAKDIASRYQPESPAGASLSGTHLGTHPGPQGAEGGVSATASQRPPIEGDAVTGTHPPRFEFPTVEEFAKIDEPSAEPLLGDGDNTAVAASSTTMTYGDGGAGKTTLTVDAAMHLAAGDEWLGLAVPDPVRVLLIENEGPRGKFRKKLDAKLRSWQGSPLGGRLRVLEEPWAGVSLANEGHRAQLAAFANEHEVDVLIVGPVVTLGMVGGGTPDEVAAFEEHVKKLRALIERPLALWLIHHENKAGDVSGAWERVPDTLMHLKRAATATRASTGRRRGGAPSCTTRE